MNEKTAMLIKAARAALTKKQQKRAFVPMNSGGMIAQAQAAPGPMPGGAPPGPGGGAPPPMDPSMMGGGGAPPMDPSMGGAPPMDPSMGGGAGGPVMVNMQDLMQLMQMMQGGGGGAPGAPGANEPAKPKGGGKGDVAAMLTDINNKLDQLLGIFMGLAEPDESGAAGEAGGAPAPMGAGMTPPADMPMPEIQGAPPGLPPGAPPGPGGMVAQASSAAPKQDVPKREIPALPVDQKRADASAQRIHGIISNLRRR